jgi:glycerol dehydrogenase-like iron-containing ADH family enzyme
MTTSNSIPGSPPLKVTKKNLFVSPSLKDLKEIRKASHRHIGVISEKRSLNYSMNSYSDALTSTRFATSNRYKGNPRMKSLEKLQTSIKEGTATDSSLIM